MLFFIVWILFLTSNFFITSTKSLFYRNIIGTLQLRLFARDHLQCCWFLWYDVSKPCMSSSFLPALSCCSLWRNCFSSLSCHFLAPRKIVVAVYVCQCLSAALIWTCSSLSLQSVGTPLLPHQKQALSWMCARENKSALPPFWEKRGELYYNSLTCFSAKEIPERVRGGILADDMGLVSNTHTYTHFPQIWQLSY